MFLIFTSHSVACNLTLVDSPATELAQDLGLAESEASIAPASLLPLLVTPFEPIPRKNSRVAKGMLQRVGDGWGTFRNQCHLIQGKSLWALLEAALEVGALSVQHRIPDCSGNGDRPAICCD
jgi:hypothetical protein